MTAQELLECIARSAPKLDMPVHDAHGREVDDLIVVDGRLVLQPKQADGVFWRNGERWHREKGREQRLMEIAPTLETEFMRRWNAGEV